MNLLGFRYHTFGYFFIFLTKPGNPMQVSASKPPTVINIA